MRRHDAGGCSGLDAGLMAWYARKAAIPAPGAVCFVSLSELRLAEPGISSQESTGQLFGIWLACLYATRLAHFEKLRLDAGLQRFRHAPDHRALPEEERPRVSREGLHGPGC